MNTQDLRARIARLDDLALGFKKEQVYWKDKIGPLMAAEQKTYLDAINEALAGSEIARTALDTACQRIDAIAASHRLNGQGND